MRWTLGVILVCLGCRGSTDCCVETASGAVLEGIVVDQASRPLVGADVRAAEGRYACDTGAPNGPAEGSAVSDASGWVRLRLSSFLGSAGAYCVDLVVTRAGATAIDTVPGFRVTFFDQEPRDTARAVIQTGL